MLQTEAPPDPPELAQLLAKFSGHVVFDIGANVGSTARRFAERFDRVVALEPATESFENLSAMAQDNDRIIPLQLAVSDVAGHVDLVVSQSSIATGQLVTSELWDIDGSPVETRSVPTTTVDALAVQYGAPDLIKCDVEGHEDRVFAGADHVLSVHRPSLFIEVHSQALGDGLMDHLRPLYPNLDLVRHPHYRESDIGYLNHFWLISD